MIVSYLGTKGGTGTTMLAVNGAADIRRITQRSTVVVDLKHGPGDVALFLGLRPRHTMLTALDHLAWIDPALLSKYVIEHDCGLHVLAGGDEFGRPSPRDLDAVEQMIRALNAVYDFVILDIGTSLMMPGAAALQLSDAIMLVANPDVPCLRNVQRLTDAVKATGVPPERIHLVLNRASEFGVSSTAQIERVLGLNIAFSVNSDYRTVASAVNSGVPVSSIKESEISAQLDAIARAVVSAVRTRSGVRAAYMQPDQRHPEM
jgi:pilus assembly protein CpaE